MVSLLAEARQVEEEEASQEAEILEEDQDLTESMSPNSVEGGALRNSWNSYNSSSTIRNWDFKLPSVTCIWLFPSLISSLDRTLLLFIFYSLWVTSFQSYILSLPINEQSLCIHSFSLLVTVSFSSFTFFFHFIVVVFFASHSLSLSFYTQQLVLHSTTTDIQIGVWTLIDFTWVLRYEKKDGNSSQPKRKKRGKDARIREQRGVEGRKKSRWIRWRYLKFILGISTSGEAGGGALIKRS